MEGFDIIERISDSANSCLIKVSRKKDGKVYLLKEIDCLMFEEGERKRILEEVKALCELKHSHIARHYESLFDTETYKLHIIMESLDSSYSTLQSKLAFPFPEKILWKIFTQLLLALYELHCRSNVILHRNLCLNSVYIDNNENLKIASFGHELIVAGEESYPTPESINRIEYSQLSETFCLGSLLYHLVTGKPPFTSPSVSPLDIAVRINSEKFDKPHNISTELNRVISWCLRRDKGERPTVSDLLNVPSVSIKIREKRLKENWFFIKKKEEELAKREEEIRRLNELVSKEAKDKENSNSQKKSRLTLKDENDHRIYESWKAKLWAKTEKFKVARNLLSPDPERKAEKRNSLDAIERKSERVFQSDSKGRSASGKRVNLKK